MTGRRHNKRGGIREFGVKRSPLNPSDRSCGRTSAADASAWARDVSTITTCEARTPRSLEFTAPRVLASERSHHRQRVDRVTETRELATTANPFAP
jgi:hypothetical protein